MGDVIGFPASGAHRSALKAKNSDRLAEARQQVTIKNDLAKARIDALPYGYMLDDATERQQIALNLWHILQDVRKPRGLISRVLEKALGSQTYYTRELPRYALNPTKLADRERKPRLSPNFANYRAIAEQAALHTGKPREHYLARLLAGTSLDPSRPAVRLAENAWASHLDSVVRRMVGAVSTRHGLTQYFEALHAGNITVTDNNEDAEFAVSSWLSRTFHKDMLVVDTEATWIYEDQDDHVGYHLMFPKVALYTAERRFPIVESASGNRGSLVLIKQVQLCIASAVDLTGSEAMPTTYFMVTPHAELRTGGHSHSLRALHPSAEGAHMGWVAEAETGAWTFKLARQEDVEQAIAFGMRDLFSDGDLAVAEQEHPIRQPRYGARRYIQVSAASCGELLDAWVSPHSPAAEDDVQQRITLAFDSYDQAGFPVSGNGDWCADPDADLNAVMPELFASAGTVAAAVQKNLAFASPSTRLDHLLDADTTRVVGKLGRLRQAIRAGYEARIGSIFEEWESSEGATPT